MMGRSTHVRIEKELYVKQKQLFPEYSASDIYKLGFSVLKKIDNANNFIYGKPKKKK